MAGARPWKNAPVLHPAKAGVYSVLVYAAVMFEWSLHTYKLLPTILMTSILLQITAFVSIPSFVFFMRWLNRRRKARGEEEDTQFLSLPSRWGPLTWSIVVMAWGCVWLMDELVVWRYAAVGQILAYAFLLGKVLVTQNGNGISARMLVLHALSLVCRNVATSWPGIILPREAGNDFVQACDRASLGLVLVLLVAVCLLFRKSYSREFDTFGIVVPVLACVGGALVFHAEVGQVGFLVDTIWTISLYLDGVGMVPQLWLIGQAGGVANEAVGHHMVILFFTRMLGLAFWWLIKGHWIQGTSYTGISIMSVYMGQLLMLSNFLCWYVKATMEKGILYGVIECTPTPVEQKDKES